MLAVSLMSILPIRPADCKVILHAINHEIMGMNSGPKDCKVFASLRLCGSKIEISGPDNRAITRAAQAEHLLTQAEQQPAARGSLLRQAAELAPANACPSLHTAMKEPTRENISQARQEMTACTRMMSLDSSRAGASNDRLQSHAILRKVLLRGEYQILKPTTPPRWVHWIWLRGKDLGTQLQQWYRTIKAFIGRLFKHIHLPAWQAQPRWLTSLGGLMRWMLYFVLLATALFLLILLVNRLLLRSLKRAAPEVRAGVLNGAASIAPQQEPTFWERSLQEAEALWQQGEQRKALRALYWACLVLLDSHGVLRFNEGRANGELLSELRRQGLTGVHDRFRPIIRCFDRSWYGFLNVSQEEFLQALENTRQFRGMVVKEP